MWHCKREKEKAVCTILHKIHVRQRKKKNLKIVFPEATNLLKRERPSFCNVVSIFTGEDATVAAVFLLWNLLQKGQRCINRKC